MRPKAISKPMIMMTLCCGASMITGKAAVIARESFDYPVGDGQSGLNGGTGWSGAWRNHSGSISTIDVGEGLNFDFLGEGGHRKGTSSAPSGKRPAALMRMRYSPVAGQLLRDTVLRPTPGP